MGMSDATFSFTIPSVQDNTPLDCRIFHPVHHPIAESSRDDVPHGINGAVFAHPWAPLGGCYDDPVVHAVGNELLRAGLIVGTFNFRGGGDSKGRTSWTGSPEIADYVSFAGLMILYLQFLAADNTRPTLDFSEKTATHEHQSVRLILGGYSYGSLIATRLPSVSDIVKRFSGAAAGSAEAEIALQARKLSKLRKASQQLSSDPPQQLKSVADGLDDSNRRVSLSITVGGQEGTLERRERSREGRRSIDIRRSLDLSRRVKSLRRRSRESSDVEKGSLTTFKDKDVLLPRTYHLLVSPLLPPVSVLTTMFSWYSAQPPRKGVDGIVTSPTLAVFGGNDGFTSAKKLKGWAERLQTGSEGTFRFVEIAEAGHFWNGPVKSSLQAAIRRWLDEMVLV